MRKAFAQALAVKGKTLPNPPVGAVIMKGRRVLGAGGTSPVGGPHAEIMALRQANSRAHDPDLSDATLYVTLEPCCHHGRTPPCTDAIIASGIGRVVVSHRDPNPKVAGKGIALLRQAGIEVIENVLAEEGAAFYRHFAHFILKGRPRIILKIAQSCEGAINAGPGKPAALTGKAAQRVNHQLRIEADAWLIGANTLRSDNPLLTPRLVKGPSPEALVLSRGGVKSVVLQSSGEMPKLLLTATSRKIRFLAHKRPRLLPQSVAFTRLPPETVAATPTSSRNPIPARRQGKLPAHTRAASRRLVRFLLDDFKKQGYHLVVIEGGRGVWLPFLQEMAFDELWLFSSPVSQPQGEKWAEGLPENWDKSLVFRSFTPLGKDQLTVFSRAE